jgi:hypothetical protein
MELSERDVHRALDIAAIAAAGGNGTAFGLDTIDAVAAAIPADEVAYVEWRFGDNEIIRVAHHPEEPAWLDVEACRKAARAVALLPVAGAEVGDYQQRKVPTSRCGLAVEAQAMCARYVPRVMPAESETVARWSTTPSDDCGGTNPPALKSIDTLISS